MPKKGAGRKFRFAIRGADHGETKSEVAFMAGETSAELAAYLNNEKGRPKSSGLFGTFALYEKSGGSLSGKTIPEMIQDRHPDLTQKRYWNARAEYRRGKKNPKISTQVSLSGK